MPKMAVPMDSSAPAAISAARSSVLVVRDLDLAVLTVTGNDRLPWLNGLVTCDLAPRRPGDGLYGLVVAQKGRILADATLLVEEAQVRLVVPSSTREALVAHLDHYLIMEDAEVRAEETLSPWLAVGPQAPSVLAAVRAAGGIGARADRGALPLAMLLAPRGETPPGLEAAVAAASGVVASPPAWDAFCLEEAIPRFGVDFGPQTYPQEAGLERSAVSFQKGCYLGQEVVCMLEMRGQVQRRLAQLEVDSAEPPAPGAAVEDDAGAHLGKVTSAGRSAATGRVLALPMVKRAFAEEGRGLRVGGAPARVVRLA